jgi:hypothetical protein
MQILRRLIAGAIAGAGAGYFLALIAAGLTRSDRIVPVLLQPLANQHLTEAVFAIGALTGAAVVYLFDGP